jgi:predicted DNA-binding transcriptional regulator YafY
MYHPTTRLLAVLELLQSRGRIGGGELARRLEVDERTVRRYVTMLRDLGIPVEAELGRYGAYRLRPGFKLPPLMFSDEEALAVVLGLLAARRMGLTVDVTATEGALAKIERVLPETLRTQVQAVSGVLTLDLRQAAQTPASDVVMAISVGAQESRRVWLRYRSSSGWQGTPDAETEREIDPYGVVYRTGRWYCVGYCHLREGPRVFRLDRVAEAQLRDERFVRPPGFDCLAYVIQSLQTLPRELPLNVLVRATIEEARQRMMPGVGTLEETEGGVVLQGTVQDPDWMAHYLASLPWPFEVREPPALKEALKRHAAALLAAAGFVADVPAETDRGSSVPAASTH